MIQLIRKDIMFNLKWALLMVLIAAASVSITSLSSFALGFDVSVQGILIACIYLLLYYAVFLGVFFRSNYGNAEKANTALLMLTVMSVFSLDRGGANLDAMVIAPAVLLAGLGVCMLAFAASAVLSVCTSCHFQNDGGRTGKP